MANWIDEVILAPVIGVVVGAYHKLAVTPKFKDFDERIDCLEKDHDQLIELKTDVKWIRCYLEKNGKRK